MKLRNIVEIVQAIDRIPNAMELKLGRWSIWPILKPSLYFFLVRHYYQDQPTASSYENSKRWLHWRRRLGGIFHGSLKLLVNKRLLDRPNILFITFSNSRSEKLNDASYLDIFTDELILSAKLKYSALILECPTTWGHLKNSATHIDLYEEPLVIIRKIIQAKNLQIKRSAENLSHQFMAMLKHHNVSVYDEIMPRVLRNSLIRFESNRILYNWLFKNRNIKSLAVLDADSVTAQVAAAKELSIPVFDFQHGAIGSNDIGYQWHPSLKTYKNVMVIPDYLLVYGKFWQDILVKNGFWLEGQVLSVGSSRMDRYRDKIQTRNTATKRIEILFTSQWTTREYALRFWNRFLNAIRNTELDVHLTIKLHPNEKNCIDQYKKLEAQHNGRCHVLFDEADTFSLMLKSDIHVSYYSTSLIESYSLSVPSVSISEGRFKDGFADSFGLSALKDIIIHVGSVEEFVQYLNNHQYRQTEHTSSEYFFEKGFVEKAAQSINAIL